MSRASRPVESVAGDDTALYNALLLVLRDAAKVPGHKVIIVFCNDPGKKWRIRGRPGYRPSRVLWLFPALNGMMTTSSISRGTSSPRKRWRKSSPAATRSGERARGDTSRWARRWTAAWHSSSFGGCPGGG